MQEAHTCVVAQATVGIGGVPSLARLLAFHAACLWVLKDDSSQTQYRTELNTDQHRQSPRPTAV